MYLVVISSLNPTASTAEDVAKYYPDRIRDKVSTIESMRERSSPMHASRKGEDSRGS